MALKEADQMKTFSDGDSFGDYRVVRRLGKGGMGEVWLMRSPTGVEVAAKILDPGAASDHEARKRFLREAVLAQGIKHPNLVETYDVGEDPETGLCYILMEYVPGGTLADRLKARGALPVAEAVSMVRAIASVLELARRGGIVHRDIKPANIMLAADGTPKLADLGIARAGASGTDTTVTQTGAVIGTPAYMAPEQMLDSHGVDTRADIYSLGVVFFEMLTGERPNKEDTVLQIMARAVKGEPLPDVRTLRPEVSASLAQLLNMMVAPQRDARVQTPGLVAAAIDGIARGGGLTATAARPRRPKATGAAKAPSRHFPWKALIPIGALAAIAAAMFAFAPKKQPATPMPTKPAPAASHAATTTTVVQTIVKTNIVEKVVEKVVVATDIAKPTAAATPAPVAATPDPVAPAPAPAAAPQTPPQAASLQDSSIRQARAAGYAWTYQIENGRAVIVGKPHETRRYERVSCISPEPKGFLQIPSRLDGIPVSKIGNYAFFCCNALTEVSVPEGVDTLGYRAFETCEALKRASLPSTLRGDFAWSFRACHSLSRIEFPAGNPAYRFVNGAAYDQDMTKLLMAPSTSDETFDIPRSVREIATNAFCVSHVKSITIPASVKKIGSRAFAWRKDLRDVAFEAPPEEMGYGVFSYSGLERIKLPAGIKALPPGVFMGCENLKAVFLPNSIERIEGPATFTNCSSLKEVVFEGDAPRLTELPSGVNRMFAGTPVDIQIVVRKGSRGWAADGSGELPDTWPPNSGSAARRIVYASDSEATGENPLPTVTAKGTVSNPTSLDDDSATKAVQKALDALFPGWKTSKNKEDDKREGYIEAHLERADCVCTHPESPELPEMVLSRKLAVPSKNPVLRFSVAAYRPMCEIRIQARVNGTPVFEEDVVGGKWRDVCISLSRWAGKQAKIELVHRAIGWNQEFAHWWRMEVGEWDGREERLAKFTPANKLLDRRQFADSNPTKAAQKAFRVLFPGWKVSETHGVSLIGFYEEFKHRHNLIMTHPPSTKQPVSITKSVKVPHGKHALHIEVASHDSGDFKLEVYVAGKLEKDMIVMPSMDYANVDVDLSQHSGRMVKIEIRHVANNWHYEMAYWSKSEVR